MILRNIPLLLILSAFIFLTACHDDNEEIAEPQILLTLNVDASYIGATDTWIMATDESGEVLDLKNYSGNGGTTVTLSSSKEVDKFNLTFLDVKQDPPYSETRFLTYADVAKGTVLNFLPEFSPAHRNASAKFRFVNYSVLDNIVATMQYSNYYFYSTSSSEVGGVFDANVKFRDDPTDILLTSYRSGVPVYNWARGVKSGDFIERDFTADFEPFPNLITLDAEGKNFGSIYGIDADEPNADQSNVYLLCQSSLLDMTMYATNTPTLGYLDGFKKYWLMITNEREHGSVTYYKEGKIGTSFVLPTYTFSLASKDIRNFSFAFSEDYTYYEAVWKYSVDKNHYTWTVNAPENKIVKILSIPSEITAKYPGIKLDDFVCSKCEPVKVMKGMQYPEIIRGLPRKKGDVEMYYYSPKI